jgi:ubiquinone biosynthesis protein
MVNWDSLLDESALASVLPGTYARFARPIRDGLIVFLEGLPAAYQAEILAQQAALPLSTGISERLGLLARSCPVLHKLGQTLARDQRLAPELRQHLQALESLPPTVSLPAIQEILRRELGSLQQRGIRLTPPAIAEASVAVVIPFEYDGVPIDHDGLAKTSSTTGTALQGRSAFNAQRQGGVLKVLKPGIEERLELELELLGRVGSYLDERCEELQIPHLDYEKSFEQVREKLSCEIRLDAEQRHLAKASAFYADEPRVHIPALLEHCTPRVTAMERITGGKVTNHRLDSQRERQRLAETVVSALIARPIFSRASQAMFHSDPHAGNMLLTDENRLAILDWSLVGSLGEHERVAIVQILMGAVTLRAGRIADVLESLSNRQRVDRPAVLAVVRARLRQIRQGELPGLSWLTGLLDDAVHLARLRVAADLMMFRKSLHTLEGVVAEISAGTIRMDDVLLVDFLQHFALEWPQRWVALPNSRDFATRLSNYDLTQTILRYPATVARFWTGHCLDLLDTCRTMDKMGA